MHTRYDALRELELMWMARGIGATVAQGNAASGGDYSHPGDDAGNVAIAAYRRFGPESAAEVLRAFKRGYDDENATAYNRDSISDEQFITTIGFAMSNELNQDETAEVRESLRAFNPRGPLTGDLPPGA